jgi:hypothetical protein
MQKLEVLVRHYRWEFLRRNSEYRRDVDQLVSDFGQYFPSKRAFWYPHATEKELPEPLERRVYGLHLRWDILEILPYDWKFDSKGRFHYEPDKYVELPGPAWITQTGCVYEFADADNFRSSLDLDDYIPEMYRKRPKLAALTSGCR